METLQEKLDRMAETSKKVTFEEILGNMYDTYKSKNSDYGNSFDQLCDEFGLISPVIRLSDKLSRLKSFVNNNDLQVKDEKIEDTLLDLANYAVITLLWLKNK